MEDKAAQQGKVADSPTGAFPKTLANLGDDQMEWNGEFIFCCFAGKITRCAGKKKWNIVNREMKNEEGGGHFPKAIKLVPFPLCVLFLIKFNFYYFAFWAFFTAIHNKIIGGE